MAKLKNYTKIGQGILLGIDVTLGGYAYHELLVNFYIGLIIAIFAVVIAIIAFAPEEYDVVKAIADMKTTAEKAKNDMPLTDRTYELLKLQNMLKSLSEVDTDIGENKSSIDAFIKELKTDKALQSTLMSILKTKSMSPEDVKSLEHIITHILALMTDMGINTNPVQNLLPLIEDVLRSPQTLNIINKLLSQL